MIEKVYNIRKSCIITDSGVAMQFSTWEGGAGRVLDLHIGGLVYMSLRWLAPIFIISPVPSWGGGCWGALRFFGMIEAPHPVATPLLTEMADEIIFSMISQKYM